MCIDISEIVDYVKLPMINVYLEETTDENVATTRPEQRNALTRDFKGAVRGRRCRSGTVLLPFAPVHGAEDIVRTSGSLS